MPRPSLLRRHFAVAAASVALGACLSPHVAAQSRDPASHPAIAEAIALARKTLPQFMERWQANEPQDTGYALKVAIGDQNGIEHLWVSQLQRRDGRIYGLVDTRPMRVRSLAAGQRIEVRADSVIDWMYFRRGRIVGNHTGRAMLPYMQPAEAEKLRLLYE